MSIRNTGFYLAAIIFLSIGCSNTPKNVVVAESDPAIQQLLQVAEEFASYERKLYEIESARYIEAKIDKIESFDMYFIPSLDGYYQLGDEWSGPIEPLLDKISEIAGLNPPRYLNVKPANHIIVYVDTNRRKLIDVLADAGHQARNRAKITLKMKERLIQVEYAAY